MEFDLESLRRDWIVGISGDAFYARVEDCRNQLSDLSDEHRAQGAIICEEDPFDFAAAFFAVLSMQVPLILANPKWGEKEWAEFNTLVSPAIAFGEVGVPPLGDQLDNIGRLKAGLQPGAILIPTGGTTSGVKLAIHDWSSLTAASAGVQAFLGGAPIDSCCLLPLYHVSGLMQLVRSFTSGGRIRFDDAEITGYCLSLVPTQLQRLLSDAESIHKLNTARAIFVGGAALPAAVAEKARSHGLPVIPVYGMTETAAMCAAVPTEDFLRDASAGAVLIGDACISIETDERIRIRSKALFKGYQGGEPIDLSCGYLTGDLGRLDSQERLHVIGRADRIIISGGEKVNPAEVERVLMEIEGIAETAVIGVADFEWGQRVVGFYVHRDGIDIENWKEILSGSLTGYKIPKQLIRLDSLPYDARGKLVVASLAKTAAILGRVG